MIYTTAKYKIMNSFIWEIIIHRIYDYFMTLKNVCTFLIEMWILIHCIKRSLITYLHSHNWGINFLTVQHILRDDCKHKNASEVVFLINYCQRIEYCQFFLKKYPQTTNITMVINFNNSWLKRLFQMYLLRDPLHSFITSLKISYIRAVYICINSI